MPRKGTWRKTQRIFYFYGLFPLLEIKRKTLKITFNMFLSNNKHQI